MVCTNLYLQLIKAIHHQVVQCIRS
uniref:Uncharacterized protein n=1 Tax=Arundo donax TaxID=35708 RepID=A0A0A9AQN8_ARUDO